MHFFQAVVFGVGKTFRRRRRRRRRKSKRNQNQKKKKTAVFPFWRKKKCVLDPDVLCWSHKKKRSTRPTKQKLEA